MLLHSGPMITCVSIDGISYFLFLPFLSSYFLTSFDSFWVFFMAVGFLAN